MVYAVGSSLFYSKKLVGEYVVRKQQSHSLFPRLNPLNILFQQLKALHILCRELSLGQKS